jgi:hypothetical protein
MCNLLWFKTELIYYCCYFIIKVSKFWTFWLIKLHSLCNFINTCSFYCISFKGHELSFPRILYLAYYWVYYASLKLLSIKEKLNGVFLFFFFNSKFFFLTSTFSISSFNCFLIRIVYYVLKLSFSNCLLENSLNVLYFSKATDFIYEL